MSNIADAIIFQLYGAKEKLSERIQAHSFSSINNGVRFEYKAPTKNSSNIVEIILLDNDTYTVKFFYKKTFKNPTLISEFKDVLCFELPVLFEKETGLFLG
jgi:hypothetical protein